MKCLLERYEHHVTQAYTDEFLVTEGPPMTNSAKISGAGLACSSTFHKMGAATIVDGIGVARVKMKPSTCMPASGVNCSIPDLFKRFVMMGSFAMPA